MNPKNITNPCETMVLPTATLIDPGTREGAEWPEDQLVALGNTATFTAPEGLERTSYQWIRQRRDRTEVLEGETGRTLTIKNTTVKEVGFYRCVFTNRDREEVTRAASLMVSMSAIGDMDLATLTASAITVYAPTVVAGGISGTCPGSYAGYVAYIKPGTAWGWVPNPGVTPRTATDNDRSDTKVQYNGKSLGDNGCNLTSVALPDPSASAKYRFKIYFPTTVPSTDSYPITLVGFYS
jgi:hypothetical protein